MNQKRRLRLSCIQIAFTLLSLLAVTLLVPRQASAHPLNNGYSQVTIDGRKVDYELSLPEISLLAFDTNGDKKLSAEELAAERPRVENYLRQRLTLKSAGEALRFELVSMQEDDKEGIPCETFKLAYSSAYRIEQLDISYKLLFEDADPQHMNFAVIINGDDLDQAVFDSQHRTYTYTPLTAGGGMPGTMLQYVWLGLTHIWSGYDHLLFLLSLLVVCAGWRDALRIVTAFTVAHSVTLGLSVAGILNVNAQWVECGIALTIAYVAAENWLLRRGNPRRYRWLLTLGFGLVHGLGFAGALQEIGLPKNLLMPSLLSFNIGIEAGQVVVLALLLPILLRLRNRAWYPRAVGALSIVVFVLAVFWTLQRAGLTG